VLLHCYLSTTMKEDLAECRAHVIADTPCIHVGQHDANTRPGVARIASE
jgi:hypothetical protein